jgi:hypothetical protein
MGKKVDFMFLFDHIDSGVTGSLAVKELAKGHWQNLETLVIGNFIIIKIEIICNLDTKLSDI